jgi:hypothetical protein
MQIDIAFRETTNLHILSGFSEIHINGRCLEERIIHVIFCVIWLKQTPTLNGDHSYQFV